MPSMNAPELVHSGHDIEWHILWLLFMASGTNRLTREQYSSVRRLMGMNSTYIRPISNFYTMQRKIVNRLMMHTTSVLTNVPCETHMKKRDESRYAIGNGTKRCIYIPFVHIRVSTF